MPNLNYAQQYQQALLQEFPYVLYFGALFASRSNDLYEWLNGDTIQIPKLTTQGRVDGDMDTIGTHVRKFDNQWIPLKVTNHRMWDTLLHPRQVQLTNMVATIVNITRVYNEQQKFPEMNAYCVSKLFADYTDPAGAAQTADQTVLDTTNILTTFDKWMNEMDEARVPRAGRIMYVTPATRTLIENAKDIYRNFRVQDGGSAIRRAITQLDDVRIEPNVPSDMMKTVYDFTSGWEVDASAKQINMILVHPDAVITPVHYEFAKLDPPSAGSQGKYIYFEESFEDVFLLPGRHDAIKFNITP